MSAAPHLQATAERAPQLPSTPVREVVDDYFGTKVSDPYRWLENTRDPEVIACLEAQNSYARAVLASIPGRDHLLDRIRELDCGETLFTGLKVGGAGFFYLKNEPGSDASKLYVRNRLTGVERLLVDPEELGTAQGAHFSIDFFCPSLDGNYVAYGTSPGGSENSVMRVVDVQSGEVLSDVIDRAQFARPCWLPDGSFFYTRTPKLPPDTPRNQRFQKASTYRHVLGGDADQETPVFGYQVSPDVNMTEGDFPFLYYSPGAPNYLLGIVMHGLKRELDVYVAEFHDGDSRSLRWKKVAGEADAVTGYDMHGEQLFLLCHRKSPRFEVSCTSLSNPDLSDAALVIPPGNVVIKRISAAGDALYVQDLDGGIGRLRRLVYESATPQPVQLPFAGAIQSMLASPTEPGVWLQLTSWTKSPMWYVHDPLSGSVSDTGLIPPSSVDYSQIESEEVQVKSADGTMVPLSIIHQRGIALDGSHPTWLQAFGAYGSPLEPMFRPTLLALLERGGVFAAAHVRGGGDFGEEWYHAGHILTKQNSIDDMVAAASYLIEQKFTSPRRLAGECTSAGGVTIGGAITQRPDLFAVALILVGWSNLLRSEIMPSGPANIPEFGTVKDPELFPAMYAMDAYHHVRPNVPYPAVLLTAGCNDPRLEVWQPAKMAARLQASSSSGKPVLLRIEYDMGHAASIWIGHGSTRTQRNEELADELAFMFWQMGIPEFQPVQAHRHVASGSGWKTE